MSTNIITIVNAHFYLQKALTFNVKIICNNIYMLHDNGTVSPSVTRTIPHILPVSILFAPIMYMINFIREHRE